MAILVVVVSLRVDLQDKSLGENDVVEKRIKKAFKDGLKRLLGFWLGGGVDKSENWWVLLKTLEEEEEANSINKRDTVTASSSSSQACGFALRGLFSFLWRRLAAAIINLTLLPNFLFCLFLEFEVTGSGLWFEFIIGPPVGQEGKSSKLGFRSYKISIVLYSIIDSIAFEIVTCYNERPRLYFLTSCKL